MGSIPLEDWATMEPVPTGGAVMTVELRSPNWRICSRRSSGSAWMNFDCEIPSQS
jgi:hypothetical protein